MTHASKQCYRAGLATAFASLLSACVSTVPLQMSDQYQPPTRPAWAAPAISPNSAVDCHLRIATIQDLRPDPQSLGTIAGQALRTSDSIAWIRSALASLSRDPQLVMNEQADSAEIRLDVELMKAYVINITGETRSANVVLRVHYERNGQPLETEIYRGTDNALTWGAGQGESQSSFNIALSQIVEGVHRDVRALCSAVVR